MTNLISNLWCYFWVSTTLSLSLFLSSCSFLPSATTQAGEEQQKTDSMSIDKSQKAQELPISAQLLINNQQIDLEIAQTQEQQQLGLMYRSSLPDNRGMLFPFEQPIMASFWMKNVVISLDMIFVSDGIVQSIAHNVPPCNVEPCPIYRSNGFIDQVIELSGGRAKELNLKSGDRLKIKYLKIY